MSGVWQRLCDGLNVGPGGQHFLLVTAVRSNELAGRLRYRDLGMVHYTNRRVRSHVRQIEALGFIVTLAQLLNHPPPA